MTMLHMIIDLIVFGVRLLNQEEFSDERMEGANQFIQFHVTASGIILCGLAIPLIAALIICAIRILRSK
ncbi:MAG: hypothetical protein MOB07_25750 [Acidobacteria bacterium]|nr:hypothetical protein [Acidobacteriota bacterium]